MSNDAGATSGSRSPHSPPTSPGLSAAQLQPELGRRSQTAESTASMHTLATVHHHHHPDLDLVGPEAQLPSVLQGAEQPHLHGSGSASRTRTSKGSSSSTIRPRRGDAGDDDEDNDDGYAARDSLSSRSDASEEAAGLVSRMSDEEERRERRARYEGGKLGGRGLRNGSGGRFLASDDEDEDDEEVQASLEGGNKLSASRRGKGASTHAGARGGMGATRKDSSDASAGGYDEEGLDSEPDEPHAPPGGRFEDRREAGGWSLRRKDRGLLGRSWEISREALPTLVLSLFSLMFSGELLVHLARWPVFVKVDKLFILVPILMNLKGNLEMNLSLRMSTSANIGELDVRRTRQALIVGNLVLLQVQALIVSLFAGILAFVLGITTSEPPNSGTRRALMDNIASKLSLSPRLAAAAPVLSPRRIIHHHPKPGGDLALKLRNGYFEFVLVLACSTLSASLSSAVLGSFMCALVVVTRRRGGNPDNIASPLAASLGDLLTLTILGLLGSLLIHFEGTFLATLILGGLLLACLSCFIITYRNTYVRELLSSGWVPLLIAMFISSGAGLVLDAFVQKYQGFALLVPVMTGLPGACAAIFVSRTSTSLHSGKGLQNVNSSSTSRRSRKAASGPLAFLSRLPAPTEGWLVPMTLFGIGTSIVMLFLLFVRLSGQMNFGWQFATTASLVGMASFAGALTISHLLTHLLWARDYDPDIYCLPFVSSIVDVLGQALLVLAFSLAILLGDDIQAAVNAGEGHGGV